MNDIFLTIAATSILILLLIAGITIAFFISSRQRAKQLMEVTQLKLSYEQELRKVEAEVSEQMMEEFAREIHDNIGQQLTAMHIQIENQKLDHPSLVAGLKPVEIYLTEVTQQLRLLSRTLNTDYIGQIGLISAIQLEIERLINLRKVEVNWHIAQGNLILEKSQELMLFRIFQEIIQNLLRHAAAKSVSILFSPRGEQFELSVEDDGKGFILESMLESPQASGLKNIIKRAKLAGIACSIDTAPQKGCRFILKK
jgi:two-component system NarL family sensor kinase